MGNCLGSPGESAAFDAALVKSPLETGRGDFKQESRTAVRNSAAVPASTTFPSKPATHGGKATPSSGSQPQLCGPTSRASPRQGSCPPSPLTGVAAELLQGLTFSTKVLGAGSFGIVIEGHLDGQQVAVKFLVTDSMAHRAAVKEATVSPALTHPHVVKAFAARSAVLTHALFDSLEAHRELQQRRKRRAAVAAATRMASRLPDLLAQPPSVKAAAGVLAAALPDDAGDGAAAEAAEAQRLREEEDDKARVAQDLSVKRRQREAQEQEQQQAKKKGAGKEGVSPGRRRALHFSPSSGLGACDRPECGITSEHAHPRQALAFGGHLLDCNLRAPHPLQAAAPQSGAELLRPLEAGCAGSPAAALHELLYRLGARVGQAVTLVVMEVCDKGTLARALHRGLFTPCGRWSVRVARRALVRTAAEVARAMLHLHNSGVLHGDLKPANVLLKGSKHDRRGFTAKVCDFGLAHVLPVGAQSMDTSSWGTPLYAAPEAMLGRVGKASDVWSFGVMLSEALSRQRPYGGNVEPARLVLGVLDGTMQLAWPELPPDAESDLMALHRRYFTRNCKDTTPGNCSGNTPSRGNTANTAMIGGSGNEPCAAGKDSATTNTTTTNKASDALNTCDSFSAVALTLTTTTNININVNINAPNGTTPRRLDSSLGGTPCRLDSAVTEGWPAAPTAATNTTTCGDGGGNRLVQAAQMRPGLPAAGQASFVFSTPATSATITNATAADVDAANALASVLPNGAAAYAAAEAAAAAAAQEEDQEEEDEDPILPCLVALGRRCTARDPANRPCFAAILGELIDIEAVLKATKQQPQAQAGEALAATVRARAMRGLLATRTAPSCVLEAAAAVAARAAAVKVARPAPLKACSRLALVAATTAADAEASLAVTPRLASQHRITRIDGWRTSAVALAAAAAVEAVAVDAAETAAAELKLAPPPRGAVSLPQCKVPMSPVDPAVALPSPPLGPLSSRI